MLNSQFCVFDAVYLTMYQAGVGITFLNVKNHNPSTQQKISPEKI
jgi:hypothetical protein